MELKRRLLEDYNSELQTLLKMKEEGVKEVAKEIWDFIDQHEDNNDKSISIDIIINDVETIIRKLENNEVEPEDVNY